MLNRSRPGQVYRKARQRTVLLPILLAQGLAGLTPSLAGTIARWTAYDPSVSGLGADVVGFAGGAFDGRYVYFAPNTINPSTYSGNVLRYDTTQPFTTITAWSEYDPSANGLDPNARGYVGAVFDGRYVYFAPNGIETGPHGVVLRYDTTLPFAVATSWSTYDTAANVSANAKGFEFVVFDERYMYFIPFRTAPPDVQSGEVLRYDTTLPFATASSWSTYDPSLTVSANAKGFEGAAFDGRYIYFVPQQNATTLAASTGEVLRYDTTQGFAMAASWSAYYPGGNGVGTELDGYAGAAFDGRYVYFAPHHNGSDYHGKVLRYDTTMAFTSASSWSIFDATGVDAGARGYTGAVFDGRFIILAPYYDGISFHSRVLRYDTTQPFGTGSSWSVFDADGNGVGNTPVSYLGAVFDGSYVYFVPYDKGPFHGEVLRYQAIARIYVDGAAVTGANNGSSWTDAFRYLQDALAQADTLNESGSVEIWVADGTYFPDDADFAAGITPGDRTETFQLLNNVALYGGFAGGETELSQRSPTANPTNLSGDLNSDDGPAPFQDYAENSFHVVTGSGANATAILDGVTIRAGNANGSFPHERAGGMHNEAGSPTVRRCTYTANKADYGAGMQNTGSNTTVTDCEFISNSATQRGGGVVNFAGGAPKFSNCRFSGNQADLGGGMLNDATIPSLTNCVFTANSATFGGGLYTFVGTTLRNCTFNQNTASVDGGGILNNSASAWAPINCIFWNNSDTGGTDSSAQIGSSAEFVG